jgi:photosystem II stability/assembly factor-like uncharacterized protein
MAHQPSRLFLSTRKGLVIYKKGPSGWKYESVHFLGIPVSLFYLDEMTRTWWACLDHGHWGCKLQRSRDMGAIWEEVTAPQYPEGEEVKTGVPATLRYIWAFSNGGKNKPGTLLIGTEPGGLFKSTHDGENLELVRSLWEHPTRKEQWAGGGRDHAAIHSIVVDPRNNDHIYIGISVAGVFETRDGGASWEVRNKGLRADYLPNPFAEIGHDPHLLVACESQPDVMWQQNHCGIFRTVDGAQNWEDISEKDGPANFGFAVAADAQNPDVAWVVPGISDEVRVAVDQSLCVSRTEDGGKSWKAFRKGLPQDTCFDIVYRHALAASGSTLAFGTTTGNFFLSGDYGESWECLNHSLPMVYAVAFE